MSSPPAFSCREFKISIYRQYYHPTGPSTLARLRNIYILCKRILYPVRMLLSASGFPMPLFTVAWFPYAPLHCERRKTLHMDSKVLVHLKKKPGQRRKAVRSDYPEVALRIIHRLYKVCRMHRTGGSKSMHIRVRQLLPPGLTAQGMRRNCAME